MKMIKKGESYMRSDARAARTLTLSIFAAIMVFLSTVVFPSSTHAATATALSTGTTHTCVVVDRKAKCWGDNTAGKLGNSSTAATTTPVAAYTKAPWSEQVDVCDSWFIVCTKSHKETVQHAGSALYGKSVTKISAGDTHTCAVANARVYCWGDNEDGQLGNRTSGWLTNSTTPIAVAIDGNSALNGREVVDVTAGDGFTCALASDGTVACWGKNDNGQLGNGSIVGKNYPVAVSTSATAANGETCLETSWGKCVKYNQLSASALAGKRVKKLATLKGQAATMCVITNEDKAVCWGQNYAGQVGNGGAGVASATGSSRVQTGNDHQCSQAGRTAVSQALTKLSTDRDALRPSAVQTSLLFQSLIVTGKEDEGVGSKIGKINQSGSQNAFAYTDLSGDLSYAYVTGKTVGATSQAYYWGGSTAFTARLSCTWKNNTKPSGGSGQGDRTIVNANVTRHYTTQSTPAGPLTNQPLSLFSGNGYPNTDYGSTFCALRSAPNTTYCDLHGASALDQGQAGNNYTAQCTSTKDGWGVTTTTCTPDPTGPQPVYTAGWLSGKTITAIDTGFADRAATHTCVIASGKVACWGSNANGQLGVGDTTLRKQPTGVNL